MANDEQKIRELISTWHKASNEGDLETILPLMAEDVIFLTPGQPPMRKQDFANGFKQLTQTQKLVSSGEAKEIRIFGEWAYSWVELNVSVISLDGTLLRRRTGNTLSILRQEADGHWVLYRDANMLTNA
jgi:uncharacterized protein (TIGR02246 family)